MRATPSIFTFFIVRASRLGAASQRSLTVSSSLATMAFLCVERDEQDACQGRKHGDPRWIAWKRALDATSPRRRPESSSRYETSGLDFGNSAGHAGVLHTLSPGLLPRHFVWVHDAERLRSARGACSCVRSRSFGPRIGAGRARRAAFARPEAGAVRSANLSPRARADSGACLRATGHARRSGRGSRGGARLR
jgi:hypothetical protein